jgi:type I restriction enzyme, S subunit
VTDAFCVDVGVLDSAPAHWEKRPLRTLIRRRDVTGQPDVELLSVYRDHGVVPKDSRDDNFNKPSEDLSSYRYVRPGDLVLNKMKTWQGSLAVSRYEGIVSPAYYVCALSPDVDPRFTHHVLRSAPYIHLYRAASKGIRPNQWDLPYEEFQRIPMLVPPLDEQRRIADFLDAETARIDQLIALQSSVRAAVQSRMVAQLDIRAEELTKAYGTVPFRRMIWSIEQGSSPQCDNFPADPGEWGVLKVSAVKNGTFFEDENKRLPAGVEPERRYEIKHGDLLITRANTPQLVGAAAVAWSPRPRLMLCDKIFRVVTTGDLMPEFLVLVSLSTKIRDLCAEASHGTSQSMTNLKTEEIKGWPIPLAPIAVQRGVARELSSARQHARALTEAIDRQLTALAERRHALITAAVTGGITV